MATQSRSKWWRINLELVLNYCRTYVGVDMVNCSVRRIGAGLDDEESKPELLDVGAAEPEDEE